jgi:hypothetical protein
MHSRLLLQGYDSLPFVLLATSIAPSFLLSFSMLDSIRPDLRQEGARSGADYVSAILGVWANLLE